MTRNSRAKLYLSIATILAFFGSNSFVKAQEEDFENYLGTEQQEIYDPIEKVNRKVFAFNEAFDKYFFEHVALGYRKTIPKTPRTLIRNFLTNLSLPISGTNSILQGDVDNGLATISTFLVNSTVGVIGLFDVAGSKNIRYNKEDFGQTLGQYGVKQGAFLILPFFGPSSTRDFGGLMVDKAINPFGLNMASIGSEGGLLSDNVFKASVGTVDAIDTREGLQELISATRKESFDFYSTTRSAYIQNRQSKIQ